LSALGALIGWRSAFVALAAVGSGTILLCVWVVPTLRESVANAELSTTYADVWRALTSRTAVRNLISANLLGSAGTWAVWTYIGAFFAQQHHAGLQYVSAVYLTCGLGLLAGNVVVARILRKRAPLRVLITCRLGAAILYGAALFIPFGPIAATAVLIAAMFCIGINQVVTADMLISARHAGRATVLAVNGSALSLGAALGAGLGGAALTLGGYAAISGCAGLISLLAVAVLVRMPGDAVFGDTPRDAPAA
jgi:predicted MFS family arabinose efflux permease